MIKCLGTDTVTDTATDTVSLYFYPSPMFSFRKYSNITSTLSRILLHIQNLISTKFPGFGRGYYYGKRSADAEPGYGYYGHRYGGYHGYGHGYGYGYYG